MNRKNKPNSSSNGKRILHGCTGLLLLLMAGMVSSSCRSGHLAADTPSTSAGNAGLKDAYRSYFPIGVAVNAHNIQGEEGKLMLKEFNSITPENDMKMGPIHPRQQWYNWKNADQILAFARAHKIKVRGHNLCWHEQTPNWMFKDSDGNEVSRDTLFQRLKSHIYTVVGRYKDGVYCWDVVNEAVADDPSKLLRDSKWLKICGPAFIDSAFWYAHQADPKAALFYNDYNAVRPEKRKRIVKLLKGLLDRGVPITGVGIQAHWSINEPSRQELTEAIEAYAALGLKVQFTELDVSVFPWEKNRRALKASDKVVYKGELEDRQRAAYKMFFQVFRKYRKDITGVTFWNLSDKDTWLDNYPVPGRKNYPLLFDTALQRKAVYYDVTRF